MRCVIGADAFRKATRTRERVIAILPILVTAAAVLVFTYILIAISVINSR
jgi:hypothetical protein